MNIEIMRDPALLSREGGNFEAAAACLLETDLSRTTGGRRPFKGSDVSIAVSEGSTQRRGGGACYELHRRYADIQYIVEGEETVVVEELSRLTAMGEFNEDKDIQFFADNGSGRAFTLHAGEFIVLMPGVAHLSGIAGEPGKVKKAVVKVLI